MRQFYCMCTLLFCTNNQCCMPIHLLLTDVVKANGGSSELIKVLNSLGAIASEDTHSRHVTCIFMESQRSRMNLHQKHSGLHLLITLMCYCHMPQHMQANLAISGMVHLTWTHLVPTPPIQTKQLLARLKKAKKPLIIPLSVEPISLSVQVASQINLSASMDQDSSCLGLSTIGHSQQPEESLSSHFHSHPLELKASLSPFYPLSLEPESHSLELRDLTLKEEEHVISTVTPYSQLSEMEALRR